MTSATAVSQMDLFEALNPMHSVSIFGYEEKLFLIRPAPKIRPNHVDLLLLKEATSGCKTLKKEDVEYNYHFCVIPSLSSFAGKSGYRRSEICYYCFGVFRKSMEGHSKQCAVAHQENNEFKHITFPTDDNYEFKKLYMLEDFPIKVFFKFQWYCEDNLPATVNTAEPLKYTTQNSNIRIHSYFLCVINQLNELDQTFLYDGQNPVEHFIKKVIELKDYYRNVLAKAYVPIRLLNRIT